MSAPFCVMVRCGTSRETQCTNDLWRCLEKEVNVCHKERSLCLYSTLSMVFVTVSKHQFYQWYNETKSTKGHFNTITKKWVHNPHFLMHLVRYQKYRRSWFGTTSTDGSWLYHVVKSIFRSMKRSGGSDINSSYVFLYMEPTDLFSTFFLFILPMSWKWCWCWWSDRWLYGSSFRPTLRRWPREGDGMRQT